ncbi:ankyrin repeat domain-containing protein 9-like [Acanthaster planci]|uniref:Ankyrin repeat domain-containing protein 9-like n=1 Tax=Acanthaster planci TaxID=133434 RepID=A0A8B7ZDT7_ACAPL|nr:ankyrin repeat domain-containing protein 9-like [Acanthaster planci]XP_022103824.1 ankyrin repeat domain-containing protein 9-like [Acanthaster planci]
MENPEENIIELGNKTNDLYNEFVRGIKEHQVSSFLEAHRMQMYKTWLDGEGGVTHNISASEALSMAIGHNHIQYIEYLLQEYPVQSMKTGGYSCSHLARAVESDLPGVVRRLLQHTLMLPSSEGHRSKLYHYGYRFRKTIRSAPGVKLTPDQFKSKKTKKVAMISYLNKASGCMMSGPSKTAVHLASELGRAACLKELLHHGAVPTPIDNAGLTPLDYALRKLCSRDTRRSATNPAVAAQGLKELLPYLPVVQAAPETVELVKETLKQAGASPEQKAILPWVLREISTPRSLQQICRHSIRSEISRARVQPVLTGVFQLPLPKLVKHYLFAQVSSQNVK